MWLTPVFKKVAHFYQGEGFNKLACSQWYQSVCGVSSLPNKDLTYFSPIDGERQCKRCLRNVKAQTELAAGVAP